ncbi:uncharacterized protein LOC120281894 [Dioscorea cayenensis subsp. rotundata]|uniref:Uncharacterized protein LOC120281894 n=1 Tax=Dioscorea cayennensis subsp. rotundata TaxID=55577 RepID=A0AB40D2S9_DIOCR|nr:uncharacterized protein LOC120281894 [Dioscorea cayenensis subsp. rotundata]
MASAEGETSNEDGGGGSIEDLYQINVFPTELFLKFRKELQGFRVGVNLEFYNLQSNDFQSKLVLKPLSPDRRWKFICEPIEKDVRLLSKKIPITKYLNLQVGIGHNFHHNLTGWQWKISTCLGGDGISQFRNKTSVSLFPGLDLRIAYRAEYILPEIHGAVGTGEPIFNMNYGKLHASIDRFEAIITHGS